MDSWKDYKDFEVIATLERKHDIRIVGNTIQELMPPLSKCDVGIKSRGKIDFLKRFRGFRHIFVKEFKR